MVKMTRSPPKFEDLPEYQKEFLKRGGTLPINNEGTVGFLKLFNKNVRLIIKGSSFYAHLDPKQINGFESKKEAEYKKRIEIYLKAVLKDLNKEIDLHKVNNNLNIFNEGVALGVYISKSHQIFFGKEANLFSDMLYEGKYRDNIMNLDCFAEIIAKYINNYFSKYMELDYIMCMPYSHKGSKTFFPLEIIADNLKKKTKVPFFTDFINKSQPSNLKFSSWIEKVNHILPNLRIDNSKALKDKNIVLIDDVYNSGAHLFATCMKLWEIPVKNIFVLTLSVSDNVKNDTTNKFSWKWLKFYNEHNKTNDIVNDLDLISLNFDKKEFKKKPTFEIIPALEKRGLSDLLIVNSILKKKFNIHARKTAKRDKYLLFINREDKETVKNYVS